MAEYIERESTLHRMKVDIAPPFKVVAEMPSADVAPVRHGRWMYEPKFGSKRPYHCPLPDCGASYPGKSLYCPNCGAKMDLEVNHDSD